MHIVIVTILTMWSWSSSGGHVEKANGIHTGFICRGNHTIFFPVAYALLPIAMLYSVTANHRIIPNQPTGRHWRDDWWY